MNAIMNETRLWFCDICDKTNNIKSKSEHTISKSLIYKKNMVLLLKIMIFLDQKLMKWII